jgi:hypothetical protein
MLGESLIDKCHDDTALTCFRIVSVWEKKRKTLGSHHRGSARTPSLAALALGQSDHLRMLSQEAWLAEQNEWIKQVLADSKDFEAKKLVANSEQRCCNHSNANIQVTNKWLQRDSGKWPSKNTSVPLLWKAWRMLVMHSDVHEKVRVKERHAPDLVTVQCQLLLHLKTCCCCPANLKEHASALQEHHNAKIKHRQQFGKLHAVVAHHLLSKHATISLRADGTVDHAFASFRPHTVPVFLHCGHWLAPRNNACTGIVLCFDGSCT